MSKKEVQQKNVTKVCGGTSMQDMDFAWYVENISKLYEQYGPCYVAIKNKTVIGKFETYADGVTMTMRKETIGTFIVQRCARSIEECIEYI